MTKTKRLCLLACMMLLGIPVVWLAMRGNITSGAVINQTQEDEVPISFEYLGQLVITELNVQVPLYVEYKDVEEPDFFKEGIAVMYWDGTVVAVDGDQFERIGDVQPGYHATLTAPDGKREFWRCVNKGIGKVTEEGLYDQFGNFWNSWFWPITLHSNVKDGEMYLTQWIRI